MGALAPIAAGIGLAGVGVSTYAGVQAANAQADALNAEATSVEQKAAFLETQQRRENKLLQGRANALAAASGVDISSGSPLFMELDRIKQGEIEALSIRHGGQLAATSARFGAKLARNQVPGIIGRGVGQGTSILTQFMGRY